MSRQIKDIIIHCSYTPESMDIGVKEIDRWHRERGWLGIGYHIVVTRGGIREEGRPIERVGAHVQGRNTNSIGICLIGGMNRSKTAPALNYNPEQFTTLRSLIDELLEEYPDAKVSGHNDWDKKKTCPNFKANKWYTTGEVEPTF